jgi:hypothetical protein
MKNDIKKDNSLLPLCRQDTKKGKELGEKIPRHLLIIADLLIIIVIVVNSSWTNTEGSQLHRS